MAAECSKSAVAQSMCISWRTVGAIVQRFVADRDAGVDRPVGLRRIGIDEISYRKGQRYMTVVVDHDTRRVVWMADGHGKQVLQAFFDALGTERAAKLTHVSADEAEWIAETVATGAPNALRAMDPFHVVAWSTEALDAERRAAWNRARRQAADPELAPETEALPARPVEEPRGPQSRYTRMGACWNHDRSGRAAAGSGRPAGAEGRGHPTGHRDPPCAAEQDHTRPRESVPAALGPAEQKQFRSPPARQVREDVDRGGRTVSVDKI